MVAQKFQPLIGGQPVAACGHGTQMGQGMLDQVAIGKDMADPGLEGGDLVAPLRLGAASRCHGHLRILKKRDQRSAQGQRQNCQKRSPSLIEKKRISARPTKFTSGTGPKTRLSAESSRLSPIMK